MLTRLRKYQGRLRWLWRGRSIVENHLTLRGYEGRYAGAYGIAHTHDAYWSMYGRVWRCSIQPIIISGFGITDVRMVPCALQEIPRREFWLLAFHILEHIDAAD